MTIKWERSEWERDGRAFRAAFAEVDKMMAAKPEWYKPAEKGEDDEPGPDSGPEVLIEFVGKTETPGGPGLLPELAQLWLKFVEVQDTLHAAARPGDWPLVLCWFHPEGSGEFAVCVKRKRKYEEPGSGTVRLWCYPYAERYDALPDPEIEDEAFTREHDAMMAEAKDLLLKALREPRVAERVKGLLARLGAELKYQEFADGGEEGREVVPV